MFNSLEELANKKILSNDITATIEQWKKEGCKIVFTNGCFDILHIGHLSYLLKAATLGDKLIVGLNSDSSVKKLKGENRPINSVYNRALMLASLCFVDVVIVFEEETPLSLIKQVMPAILVKGGDYTIENIVGAKEVQANSGEVVVIKFIEGYSSTAIIQKINNTH
jgi:rfaE bifunctional protein nucleotidyltransferase chain/domain